MHYALPFILRGATVDLMQIKLVALDIDGTLLNPRSEITPRTRKAIQAARDAGVKVVLVTGRRFESARPIAAELGLDVPLVSHNGALTKDAETLEVIDQHLLDRQMALRIIELGRQLRADILLSDDPAGRGVVVIDRISDDNHSLHRYLGYIEQRGSVILRVPDLIDYLDHSPIQLTISGRCQAIDEVAEVMGAKLDGQAKLLMTCYPAGDLTILDLLNPVCSKGAGLAAMAQTLGIPPSQVMAIGDNYNDIEMLQYAGVPVLMGNAENGLRQMGFHLTASNDEDGAAQAIEKFILSQL